MSWEFDTKQAMSEGWALFQTQGTDDEGDVRLERVDEMEVFPNDQSAWEFVARKACLEISLYHLEALKVIEANNSTEFENIENHVCLVLGINSVSSFFHLLERKAKIEKIRAAGCFIGPRDEAMNTDFLGSWMVSEPYPEGHTQSDGRGGIFCVVGDNVGDLIDAATFYFAGELA